MTDKPKTKWRWRLLRWGLIGLAVIVTLAAVLITEEDWRGKRAWENYRQEAEARGEHFSWTTFFTNNVPDDENFFKTSIFKNLMAAQWDEKTQNWQTNAISAADEFKMSPYRMDGSDYPNETNGSWERARLTRLEGWQDYYRHPPTNYLNQKGGESASNLMSQLHIRAIPDLSGTNIAVKFPIAPQPQTPAADVLLALSVYDPAIETLREASRRPFARIGGYSAIEQGMSPLLLYLSEIKGWFQVLQLRGIAELDDKQSDKALDDVQLMLRLDDKLRQEPLLIDHLVSLALISMTLVPIYEGLAQHRWNDTQLAELENALAAKDFLADYQYAMRGERIFAVDTLENQRITREYKTMADDSGKIKMVTVSLRWTPSAFFYQSELTCARLNEQLLLPLVDATNRLVSPAAVRRAGAAVQTEMKHYNPYKVMALMMFPAISKAVEKFASAQSSADLARVACALERYRLAHGEYPETLDPLAPQFIKKLPHDIINGQPLHYRRTADGQFVLYSVGWNETDDGGQVALTSGGSVNREKGDWVWRYPAQ